MNIVCDERVPLFVASRIGHVIVPPYTAMGVERDGEVIGGVIFNHFTGFDCHVTVAGTGWTRGFLECVGDYVYTTMNCLRVTIITEQPKVVRLAQKMGGEIEGLMRNHFGPEKDAFVVGVLKEDYKW